MHRVTVKDFPGLALGDIRRNDRFVTIINNITAHPGSSIPRQNNSWYDTKASYNFFRNKEVSVKALQDIMKSYGEKGVAGLAEILVIHDISNISYNNSNASGLGYLDNKAGKGIMCYTSMAVSPTGMPLSLLRQHLWTRDFAQLGKSQDRKKQSFENKESYFWYEGVQQVNKQLNTQPRKIHIADREADIYELFFQHFAPGTELLIRARHNRRIASGGHLWDQIGAMPACAAVSIEVPDKTTRKKKQVSAEVRYRKIEILRPQDTQHSYDSVELTAIEVKQTGAVEGIHWKLLTTLEINDVPQALQCVKWYTYRWLIERFHYVLKSGTRIEDLQLRTAENLQKAVLVYSLAAFMVMQMTYMARACPEASCEVVLPKAKWEALYILTQGNQNIPAQPPSLKQAVMWIAKLGGHLGRKSDGPPGTKTVWLGYQQLSAAVNIYLTMKNLGKV